MLSSHSQPCHINCWRSTKKTESPYPTRTRQPGYSASFPLHPLQLCLNATLPTEYKIHSVAFGEPYASATAYPFYP